MPDQGQMEPSLVEKEIRHRFTYHPPTEGQPEKYEAIRDMACRFALDLIAMCPDSRELSLALTHLEDVVYCANAAIARRS